MSFTPERTTQAQHVQSLRPAPAPVAQARTRRPGSGTPAAPSGGGVRRWLLRAAGLIVVLIVLGGVAAWQLIGQRPLWWRSVNAADPATIDRAKSVENMVINEVYQRRAADPVYQPTEEGSWRSERWVIRIPVTEANAWLNARLPKWMANQHDPVRLPSELEGLRVEFQEGVILVGAQVRAGGQTRIFTATLEPELAPDGSLWLPARWVHVGRLPVPVPVLLRSVGAVIRRMIPPSVLALPETEAMARAFAGEQPVVERPVLRLEDGRRVRVLAVRPRDGVLEITCQTERP